MTAETLKRLEELNDKWANDPFWRAKEKEELTDEVMDHLPDLIAAVKELDELQTKLHKMDVTDRLVMDTLAEQRDAAQKACAEMRDALLETTKHLENEWESELRKFSDNQTYRAVINQALHALSTDCGKGYIRAESLKCFKCSDGYTPLYCLNCAREGYVSRKEVEPLVEALKKIITYVDLEGPPAKEWMAITEWCEHGKQALSQWEKDNGH